jgi:aerobic-type carbon monoxide dehydrogenase small subunit (CoxS/CutS family)
VRFPPPPAGAAGRYLKLGRNKAGDLAIVGVAVLGFPDATAPSGYRFRIALASVAPVPLRTPNAEAALEDGPMGEPAFAQAADLTREAASPIDDVRASAAYRSAMVHNLTLRGLRDVWAQLQGGSTPSPGALRLAGRPATAPLRRHNCTEGCVAGRHEILVTVNGEQEQLVVPANATLLDMLRERLAQTGTKNGCGAGECGACTILMNGEPVNACMVLAVEAGGAEVVTVEGLAQDARLDVLQQAFVDEAAVQCGFCTPGMLISARALLNRSPLPTEEEIREAFVGNLCRCTGYTRIVRAVQRAAQAKQ